MESELTRGLSSFLSLQPQRTSSFSINHRAPLADIIRKDDVASARRLFDDSTQAEVYDFLFGKGGCVDNLAMKILKAFLPYLDANYQVTEYNNPYMALYKLFDPLRPVPLAEDEAKVAELAPLIVARFPYRERYRRPDYLTKNEIVRQLISNDSMPHAAVSFLMAFGLPSVIDSDRDNNETSYPLITYALHIDNWPMVEALTPHYDITPLWLLCEASRDRLVDEGRPDPEDDGLVTEVIDRLIGKYNYSVSELSDALWFCQDNVYKTAALAQAIRERRREPRPLPEARRKF